MFCPSCGKEILNNKALFCENCGKKLSVPSPLAEEEKTVSLFSSEPKAKDDLDSTVAAESVTEETVKEEPIIPPAPEFAPDEEKTVSLFSSEPEAKDDLDSTVAAESVTEETVKEEPIIPPAPEFAPDEERTVSLFSSEPEAKDNLVSTVAAESVTEETVKEEPIIPPAPEFAPDEERTVSLFSSEPEAKDDLDSTVAAESVTEETVKEEPIIPPAPEFAPDEERTVSLFSSEPKAKDDLDSTVAAESVTEETVKEESIIPPVSEPISEPARDYVLEKTKKEPAVNAEPIKIYTPKAGSKTLDEPAHIVVPPSNPIYTSPQYINSGKKGSALVNTKKGMTRSLLRKLGYAPILLLAILAFTAMVVINFITTKNEVSPSDRLEHELKTGALDAKFDDILDRITESTTISAYDLEEIKAPIIEKLKEALDNDIVKKALDITQYLGILPDMLLCVGMLWVLLSVLLKSKNAGGLIIINIVVWLQLVMWYLILFAVDAFFIIFGLSIYNSDKSGRMIQYANGNEGAGPVLVFTVVAGVLVTIALILIIVYYTKVLKTINTMTYSINSGIASDQVSGYVGAMTVLFGIISLIILLVNRPAETVVLVTSMLDIIARISFGAFIFVYKSKMFELERTKTYIDSQI